jgi:hypothetical protein
MPMNMRRMGRVAVMITDTTIIMNMVQIVIMITCMTSIAATNNQTSCPQHQPDDHAH